MSKSKNHLYLETYSKIIWGQQTNVVLQYLQSKGLTTQESTQIINECLKERKRMIKSYAFGNILKGGLVFLSSLVVIFIMKGSFKLNVILAPTSFTRFSIYLFAILIVTCFIGGYFVVDGLLKFSNPNRVTGAIKHLD